MRLLRSDSDGHITLTDNLYTDIPRYAILSHTWGTNSEEVTFDDLKHGQGQEKGGWAKVDFCMAQSASDGFEYCWIDSCCIDKSSSAELTEALNSMFKWYANAQRCYVYLSDVPSEERWETSFRGARWFRRGWTLQELLAPPVVDFFSADKLKLGDRESLIDLVSDVTKIPGDALHGQLGGFSTHERLQWHKGRQTTRDEDIVYSLLGLLGVTMTPRYGEGQSEAEERLKKKLASIPKASRSFIVTSTTFGYTETDHFVGRMQELEQLRTALDSDGSRCYALITSLAGQGKTQLAAAYARKFRQRYSATFWINAQTQDTVDASYLCIAEQLKAQHSYSLKGHTDADKQILAVKEWLSMDGNTRWLMVCDNYCPRGAFALQNNLPHISQGTVIITARQAQWNFGVRTAIQLRQLPVDDALSLLAHAARRPDLTSDTEAGEVAAQLGYLPLALEIAGGYLQPESLRCADYIRDLDQSWVSLQQHSPIPSTYNESLLSTWQSTYDQLTRESPLAASLCHFWTHIDHRDLWYELLNHDELTRFTTSMPSRFEFIAAMRALCDIGFAQVHDIDTTAPLPQTHTSQVGSPESSGYTLHPCVHAWLRHANHAALDADVALAALFCTVAHIPELDLRDWSAAQQRLLNHTKALAKAYGTFHISARMLESFHKIGVLLTLGGKLSEAVILLEQVLEARTALLGVDHEQTTDTLVKLGHAYFETMRTEDAQRCYEDGLERRITHLGPEHKLTLQTRNSLANTYVRQENYVAAEAMFARALEGLHKAYGAFDVVTLNTTNNLAIVYVQIGFNDRAIELYNSALRGYKRVYGKEHTSALQVQNNLAVVHETLGHVDEAEDLFRKSLQGRLRVLGPQHPDTLASTMNLSRLLSNTDRLPEAVELMRTAVDGYSKAHGPQHPATLLAVKGLGMFLNQQNAYAEAETIFMRLITSGNAIYSQIGLNFLGIAYYKQEKWRDARDVWLDWLANESDTATNDALVVLHSLGDVYYRLDDFDNAESIQRQRLAGLTEREGADGDSTMDALFALGVTLEKQGKLDEMLAVKRQVHERHLKFLGQAHIKTIRALQDLATTYAQRRQWVLAKPLLEELVEAGLRDGSDDDLTLNAATMLGTAHWALHDYAGAQRAFEQAVRGLLRLHGPDSARVSRIRGYLASCLLSQQKGHEAKQVYQEVLEARQRTLPAGHSDILATLQHLAFVLVSLGELDAAESHINHIIAGWNDRQDGSSIWLRAKNTLGEIYKKQGRLEDARNAFHLCADNAMSVDGAGEIIISSGTQLANLYKELDRREDAKLAYERTLWESRRIFGEDHHYTLELTNDLGHLHFLQGNIDTAEHMYLAALPRAETLLGPAHMLTLYLLVNLAHLCARQGRIEETRLYWKRASPHIPADPSVGKDEIREIEQTLASAVKYDNSQIYDYLF